MSDWLTKQQAAEFLAIPVEELEKLPVAYAKRGPLVRYNKAVLEKFIDEHRDGPFFLYVPHNTPHIPLAAKAELVVKHKDAFNPVYAAMMETMDDCVGRILKKLDEHASAGD